MSYNVHSPVRSIINNPRRLLLHGRRSLRRGALLDQFEREGGRSPQLISFSPSAVIRRIVLRVSTDRDQTDYVSFLLSLRGPIIGACRRATQDTFTIDGTHPAGRTPMGQLLLTLRYAIEGTDHDTEMRFRRFQKSQLGFDRRDRRPDSEKKC